MQKRAELLSNTFNSMINTKCTKIEGAMYAFPEVIFSPKALKKAEKEQVPADFMYCMDMLNETGIMTVPGSGFGQIEGTHHFRITNLVSPTSDMKLCLENLEKFNDKFHARYE
mgnify:CR=1 FL=1